MELKEFKEKFQSKIIDAIANSGSFTLSNLLTDGDIHATKEDVEELLSLVNEYIEDYEKPKFKVGDYVTIYDDFNDEKYITKINEMEKTKAFGFWYITKKEIIKKDYWFTGGSDAEHATQEEIAEYKAALQFHEHGRNPFEIKVGDLVQGRSMCKFFVDDTNDWNKDDFANRKYTFLKSVEEVEAWLQDGKTDIG